MIVTCTHVLEATAKPDKVKVALSAMSQPQHKQVEIFAVVEVFSVDTDVTVLRLENGLPEGVQVLPLGSSMNTIGDSIRTYGFPKITDEGFWGKGEVIGPITFHNQPMLQLKSDEVTGGYSGAPIWDGRTGKIIGMAKKITLPDNARLSNSFMAIPTETLQAVDPRLGPSLDKHPYRNLDAFTEADAAFFFGRQQVVNELLEKLRSSNRFLALLGPSGSGKSSVVQAGLIPLLRQNAIAGSRSWEFKIFRPGDDPFKDLTTQGIIDKSRNLKAGIRAWLDKNNRDMFVLIIDQFEELFVELSKITAPGICGTTKQFATVPRADHGHSDNACRFLQLCHTL